MELSARDDIDAVGVARLDDGSDQTGEQERDGVLGRGNVNGRDVAPSSHCPKVLRGAA
jgi:hypothetical protein